MKKLLLFLILLFLSCKIETVPPKITAEKLVNQDGVELMFYADSIPMWKEWLFIPFPKDRIIKQIVYDTVFVLSKPYYAEWDSLLKCEKRIIRKSSYCFHWKHDFLDTLGNFEQLIYFEVGGDFFKTRDDVIHWRPDTTIWYGKHYAPTDLSEFKEGRNQWEFVCSGISLNEYAVFSVRAIDKAGNKSGWMRSTDSTLVRPPFYILREK